MPKYPSSKPYMCVRYLVANTAQAGLHDLFDTTNYGGTTFVVAENGITYDATNGDFTLPEKGVYSVTVTAYWIQSGTGELTTFRVKVNNLTQNSANPNVHSSVDTVERTMHVVKEMEGNDVVTVDADSFSTTTLQTRQGTMITIWKLD